MGSAQVVQHPGCAAHPPCIFELVSEPLPLSRAATTGRSHPQSVWPWDKCSEGIQSNPSHTAAPLIVHHHKLTTRTRPPTPRAPTPHRSRHYLKPKTTGRQAQRMATAIIVQPHSTRLQNRRMAFARSVNKLRGPPAGGRGKEGRVFTISVDGVDSVQKILLPASSGYAPSLTSGVQAAPPLQPQLTRVAPQTTGVPQPLPLHLPVRCRCSPPRIHNPSLFTHLRNVGAAPPPPQPLSLHSPAECRCSPLKHSSRGPAPSRRRSW